MLAVNHTLDEQLQDKELVLWQRFFTFEVRQEHGAIERHLGQSANFLRRFERRNELVDPNRTLCSRMAI